MQKAQRKSLRDYIGEEGIVPFIGVYDVFSASIAARHFEGIFLSGYGFSASFYGLPDNGYISWDDMVSFTQRVKTALPNKHLIVDIDDGYGDADAAARAVATLEDLGASGVVMEDQKRPKRCGHLDGKELVGVAEFTDKLTKVLSKRKELMVIARTDASDSGEILERAVAYASAGADAILVDAIKDAEMLKELKAKVGKPFAYNQIAGGKSPSLTLGELKGLGVSLVIYSTPCLFAAQPAIERAITFVKENDGLLPDSQSVELRESTALLDENLVKMDEK
jgi:2-methylisocitrate lyase-like PEP mutase family enzyme